MTEQKINALKRKDTNLCDALRMDEAERTQMPADLNARLMKRVGEELAQKKHRRVLWPWIAAAGVAAIIAVYLTLPKGVADEVDKAPVVAVKVEQPATPHEQTATQQPEVQPVQTPVRRMVAKVQPKKVEVSEPVAEEPMLAQEVAPVEEKIVQEEPAVTLTERDIPITRPENYKYTPEEIAQMKKQANEAYLKWAQLELEIAKHNLEQTAQK